MFVLAVRLWLVSDITSVISKLVSHRYSYIQKGCVFCLCTSEL